MPQLILEYSANIIENKNFTELFKNIHEVLEHTLPADLATCKSRAVEQENYYVGNGNPKNAFVSVHLKVMEGRSSEILHKTSESIMNLLKKHFQTSLQELNLEITLQLQELSPTKYSKIKS